MLLTSLEDVSLGDAAPILDLSSETAAAYLADARDRLRAAAATDVLIIETNRSSRWISRNWCRAVATV